MKSCTKKSGKKTKSSVLADQISQLTNCLPLNVDEDYEDGTLATDNFRSTEPLVEGDAVSHSKRSMRATADMEELSFRYKGAPISRKELDRQIYQDDFIRDESDESGFEDEEVDESEEAEEEGGSQESESDGSEEEEEKEEVVQENVFKGTTQLSVMDELTRLQQEDLQGKEQFTKLGQRDFQKAQAAKNYKGWWDNFFQTRILLQRIMNITNRFPPPESFPLFAEKVEDSKLSSCAQEIHGVLTDLITIRDIQQSSHPKIIPMKQGETELPVQTEEIWKNVDAGYKNYKAYWQPTLETWHQKTQLATPGQSKTKFKVFNQGLWAQVEAVLADLLRAKRKLHPLTSEKITEENKPIGRGLLATERKSTRGWMSCSSSEDNSEEEVNKGSKRKSKGLNDDLDIHTFDDTEFYQQQLKEYIHNSYSEELSTLGPLNISKVTKKKRKVDTKASKDRKLKFVVYPKLENFMYPRPLEQELLNVSELYASLFGKN